VTSKTEREAWTRFIEQRERKKAKEPPAEKPQPSPGDEAVLDDLTREPKP
jgi:hypothetical protein